MTKTMKIDYFPYFNINSKKKKLPFAPSIKMYFQKLLIKVINKFTDDPK